MVNASEAVGGVEWLSVHMDAFEADSRRNRLCASKANTISDNSRADISTLFRGSVIELRASLALRRIYGINPCLNEYTHPQLRPAKSNHLQVVAKIKLYFELALESQL